VVFRNQGDAAQTRDNLGRYFHGISYGSNANSMNNGGLDLLRISTLDHAGRVLYFNSGNYRIAANFTSAAVAGNETPGAPNNAANTAFIATFDCPLPVELLSFNAEAMGDRVRLRWTTASETQNELFVVERSANAAGFEGIANVPGAGTSSQRRDYVFDDAEPLVGTSYYRLRQVDTDGSGSVSDVVAVERKHPVVIDASIDAWGWLRISGAVPGTTFMLCDVLGRSIAAGSIRAEPFTQPIPSIPIGTVVLLVIHDPNGSVSRKLLAR